MMYGLNFNETQIPDKYARRFRKRVKIEWLKERGAWYHLQGVCESWKEVGWMVIQADNGHRLIHIEQRRCIDVGAEGYVYGIYTR